MSNIVTAFAPSNIALIKYWGKQDRYLKTPTFNSLSVTLKDLNTITEVSFSCCNQFILNNQEQDFKIIEDFVSLFNINDFIKIQTVNNFPTAAGLASSASGYCALGLALNQLSNLKLHKQQLSTFIRKGSGSACRSLFGPFVIWKKGNDDNSYSFLYPYYIPMKAIVVICDNNSKKISSREMMNIVQNDVDIYETWLNMTKQHYFSMLAAIKDQDFDSIGTIAIDNAHLMHNSVISIDSKLSYFNNKTLAVIDFTKFLRNKYRLFYTIDAGPNVVIFVTDKDFNKVLNEVKTLNLDYIVSSLSNGGYVFD